MECFHMFSSRLQTVRPFYKDSRYSQALSTLTAPYERMEDRHLQLKLSSASMIYFYEYMSIFIFTRMKSSTNECLLFFLSNIYKKNSIFSMYIYIIVLLYSVAYFRRQY